MRARLRGRASPPVPAPGASAGTTLDPSRPPVDHLPQLRRRVTQLAADLERVAGSMPQDAEARLALLEDEIQECRALGLRVAELADLVIHLLSALAQPDRPDFAARVQTYLDDGVESPAGGP